jgi:hypothetical protein
MVDSKKLHVIIDEMISIGILKRVKKTEDGIMLSKRTSDILRRMNRKVGWSDLCGIVIMEYKILDKMAVREYSDVFYALLEDAQEVTGFKILKDKEKDFRI